MRGKGKPGERGRLIRVVEGMVGEVDAALGGLLVRSWHSPETPCMYQVHRCAVPSHARCYVVFESISTTLSSEKSGTSNVETWDVDAIPHGAF